MAFTNNTWQGSTGDWNTTTNWSLGVKPGALHVAVFDGTSSISVTTNLDQTADAFEQLLVKPGYGGNIGSQGNPLIVDLGTSTLVWRGRGRGYIAPLGRPGANVCCDVPNPLSGERYNLVLGGTAPAAAGGVGMVGIKKGNVNIAGDLHCSYAIHMLGQAARLVLDANLAAVDDPTHIICAAGELVNKRPLQADMVLIVGDRSRVTQIAALVATTRVVVIGNGKFQYLPTTAPGTSPLLTVLGGVYDQTDEKWDNVWGTTVIGPDASIIGGAVRGTNLWPPSLDFSLEYPGTES